MTKGVISAIPRPMNPYRHFIGEIEAALRAMQAAGDLPPELDFSAITAEPPRDVARLLLGGLGQHHGGIGGDVAVRGIARPQLDSLRAMGHKMRQLRALVNVNAIMRVPGGYHGVHEPRAAGGAAGF